MQVHVEVELLIGYPHEHRAPQRHPRHIDWRAPVGGGQPFGFPRPILSGERAQIERAQLNRWRIVVDNLQRLLLAHLERGPPDLVTAVQFVQRSL